VIEILESYMGGALLRCWGGGVRGALWLAVAVLIAVMTVPILQRLDGAGVKNFETIITESAFANTPWTFETIKPFSHDERYR